MHPARCDVSMAVICARPPSTCASALQGPTAIDQPYSCIQMALLFEEQKIKLFNVTSNCEEPDKLDVITTGKQWLVAPNGAALLALHHDASQSAWVMDTYALESCLPEQHLFQQLAQSMSLPTEAANLSAMVCSEAHMLLLVNQSRMWKWWSAPVPSTHVH
jgi:hypothetical protein